MKKMKTFIYVLLFVTMFSYKAKAEHQVWIIDSSLPTNDNITTMAHASNNNTQGNTYEVIVNDGVTFNANNFNTASGFFNNSYYGLFAVAEGSSLIFEGSNVFSKNRIFGNSVVGGMITAINNSPLTVNGNMYITDNTYEANAGYLLGSIYLNNNNIIPSVFNGKLVFENNTGIRTGTSSITMGGMGIVALNTTANFNDEVVFKNNTIKELSNSTYLRGWGGALTNWSNSKLTFNKKVTFDNNKIDALATDAISSILGGAVYSKNSDNSSFMTFNGETLFINNSVSSNLGSIYGGAIYSEKGTFNFNDSVVFRNNEAFSKTINSDVYGGAIYSNGSIFNFTLADAGKSIVFENNYISRDVSANKVLNSIHFTDSTTQMNFDVAENSYVNIRDPMTGSGEINKKGGGSFYLWGDNTGYSGQVKIDEGSFYAMFDKVHDVINDPNGQRLNFDLSGASVAFANGTLFRPMITWDYNTSSGQMASLNSAGVSTSGKVDLVPYSISGLNVGSYDFNNTFTVIYGSWESDLAKVTTGANTEVEVKRDLEGYQNLSALADIYRKREDLSLMERELLDNIYYTGVVSDEIKDMFEVLGGNDIMNYEQVHRSSIRQFNRQISSRIQNKDCSECGAADGFSSEHLWFNVGQNWMEKDTTRKSLGYKYKPTSLALGYDYDFIPKQLNLGVAFSYAFGEAETKARGVSSTNDIDEYLLSVYGKYKPSRAYITASLGGGVITNDTKFVSSGVNSKAAFNTYAAFAHTELGYDLGNGWISVEPFTGLEYTHIYNDSYKEKGIGARYFDSMSWNTIEIPVGVRLSKDVYYNYNIITPAIEVAYARNVGDTGSGTNAHFVGNPASSWKIGGASESRDSIRTNFNLKLNNQNQPFAVNLGYARDTRSDYKDDQLYLTIRYNF